MTILKLVLAGCPDGDLAGFGGAQRAGGDDDITQVRQFGDLKGRVIHGFFTDGDLQIARGVTQRDEYELADIAVQHDAAGDLGGGAVVVFGVGFGGLVSADSS